MDEAQYFGDSAASVAAGELLEERTLGYFAELKRELKLGVQGREGEE